MRNVKFGATKVVTLRHPFVTHPQSVCVATFPFCWHTSDCVTALLVQAAAQQEVPPKQN